MLGIAVCGAVATGGVLTPSWAGAEPAAAEPQVLGGFALGDGVEGMIDPRTGAFSFGLPAAGVAVAWDSRRAQVDSSGLGGGWAIAGLAWVEAEGGLRVSPSSGGVYEADASAPSGLAGYLLGDVVFTQGPVTVPARADGLRAELEAAYELAELGGVRTYFSAEGDPVVRLDADGNRSDWEWASGRRLTRTLDASGRETTLDWSDPGRVEVITAAGPARTVGVIELDGRRVSAVVDASGGRVQVGYSPADLVDRIAGVSGAATELTWQRLDDGQVAVDDVRVIEAADGVELSTRRWEARAGLASGWPAQGDPSRGAADHASRFATAISDGSSVVVSEFDGHQRMLERSIEVTTSSGALVVQRQAYAYPEGGEQYSGWLPPQFAQPIEVTATHLNAAGGARVTSESLEFDDLGRLTRQVAEDGTTTDTRYDDVVAEGGRLPVGLPLSRRVSAPDGLVSETRFELNPARTAQVVIETATGGVGGAELTSTGRQEFEVDPDGFVRAERVWPQHGDDEPVATLHMKETDLAGGTVTTTTTVAAGTPAAATITRVSDLLHGGILEETGPTGAIASAVYDPMGRPVEQIDAAGNVTRTEYRTLQQHGENVTVTTRPDEVVTTVLTDVLGRVVQTTDNILDGDATPGHERVVETRSYPGPGVVRVTDAWGATTTATEDVYGRVVRSVAANGTTELRLHDDVANTVTTALTPTGHLADAASTSTEHLDARGRATQVSGSRADGVPVPTRSTTLDGFGRSIATTDGLTTTSVEYDPFGNPSATSITPEPDEGRPGAAPMTAIREFDAFGASVAKTLTAGDEARRGAETTYDVLGRPSTWTDQDGGSRTHDYTPDGLVASTVTSYGQVTVNEYDPDTRVLTQTTTTSPIGEAVTTRFDIDPVTGTMIGVFDPEDRPGTELRYEYDAWGNPTRLTYPDGNTVEHEYDEHGRLEVTIDVAGNRTRYEFDAAGQLAAAAQTDRRGASLGRVEYRYDAYGRMTEQSRGNGVTTSYAYTSANQVARETATRPDGTTLTDRAYEYDAQGRLALRTDTRPAPDTGAPETTTTSYEYDAFDRLVGSSLHDDDTADRPAHEIASYELTVGGDIRTERITRHPGTAQEQTVTRAFEYGPTGTLTGVTTTDAAGERTTATQEYDEAGNLTRAVDGTAYAYNAHNQPVAETAPDGTVIRIGYWATGQRATRGPSDSAAGTVFHWDGATLVNDTHTGDGTTMAAGYLVGLGRHARTVVPALDPAGTEATTAYYEADFHGNVTELTDADAVLTTSYTYTDYGIATTRDHAGSDPRPGPPSAGEASRNPFQYAGEYADPSGTQHLQERTYDPRTMRLTSVDPEPQHNRYHYAALNPISLADPTGRLPDLPEWTGALLAGVGLIMAGVGALFAVQAFTTAVAVATTTIGTKAVLLGTAAASLFDLAVSGVNLGREFDDTFMDDDLAFRLDLLSAAAGGSALIAGIAASRAARVDINRLMTAGAEEGQAWGILAAEKRAAKRTAEAFQELGAGGDVDALMRKLHAKLAKKSRVDGNWSAGEHLRLALEFDDDLIRAAKTPRVEASSHHGTSKQIYVSGTHFAEVEKLFRADSYAESWKAYMAIDLVKSQGAARKNVTGKLARTYEVFRSPAVDWSTHSHIRFVHFTSRKSGALDLPVENLRPGGKWLHETN